MATFGIMTAPQQVDYPSLLQVWQDADAIPEIRRAWLFDHLLPIQGDIGGPIFEGWTLLSALAAATQRLRLGILVTSNRLRPPAVLAKIATTVDVVSGGRLDFGIGAGSRPDIDWARREYEAHGLPYHDFGPSVAALVEACNVIKRLWTEDAPFDFEGEHVHLIGAWASPKPLQRPHPPIVIGGRSTPTLRVVAEYADVWNVSGDDLTDVLKRNARLDQLCTEIGRDPATIRRSIAIPVSYEQIARTRAAVADAVGAGFSQIELIVPSPYPARVARWIADEIIQDWH